MTFLTEAWFWRGTQSAVFYYLSCAPCTRVNDQRKKRRQAKGARKERKEREKQGIFQHPLPSELNPGWNEEIREGPGPPPNRLTKEEKKRRRLLKLKPRDLESAGESTGTGAPSEGMSDGPVVSQDISRTSEEGWNRRRYQREDEMLWGRIDEDITSSNGFSRVSSSARGSGTYYCARNPEVNELHPPVVSSHPASKSETRWMLQPPPKAKVMEGKERENRSRSGSGTSGGSSLGSRGSSRRGGENLGRRIGERIMEEKMAKDGLLHPTMSSSTMSRIGSNRSTISFASGTAFKSTSGQRHDRDASLEKASKDSLQMSEEVASGNASYFPTFLPDPFVATHAAARPPLSTIPSTSYFSSSRTSKDGSSPPPRSRPPLLSSTSDSSLRILQNFNSLSVLANGQAQRNTALPLDVAKSTVLPPTPREEKDGVEMLQVENWRPQLDDSDTWSLPIPGPEVPIKHRWSMEI